MKKLAAIYTRISGEDQSEFSLPSQQQACEMLAAAKGFQTSDEFIFTDNGGSSVELDRSGLAAMREAVNAGVVQAVVIHSLDRLSRKVVHQLLLLEEFQKRNVAVLFVDAPNDDSPEGKMLLTIKGLFSEYEREKIRERTVRGSRQRAKEGKVNGRAPFGFATTEAGLLIPHPERAKVVQTIFTRIIEGKTCGEVAESLNGDGIPAPGHTKWIRGVVLQIARRRAYLGQLDWGVKTAAEPVRRRKPASPGKTKLTSQRRRPEKDWIRIGVPQIIDPTTFEQAQQAIAGNRKSLGGRPSETYLLTGIVRCGRCGAAVCGSYSHGYPYYKCSGSDPVTGKRSCGERSIRLEAIEPHIWSDVVETLSSHAQLSAHLNAQFAEAVAKETDHATERAKLASQIELLRRREFRAAQALLDNELADSRQTFRDALKETQSQRRAQEARLAQLQPAQQPAQPESFSELCRQMKRARTITDRGQQKAFLQACIEQVTLTREEVNVQFSLNLPAAMAAIEQASGGSDGSGSGGTNRQLRLGSVGCELCWGRHTQGSSTATFGVWGVGAVDD